MLIIWRTGHPTLAAADSGYAAAAEPLQVEVIPHAGHDLTFVQPEMVSQKIVAFLEQ